MPVVINGTGAVTGVTSLPDGIVTVDDLSTSGTASASTFLSGTGAWAAAGGGVIKQVLSATKTDTFDTNSSSFVDVTGVTIDVTPSSTSNKVWCSITGWASHSSAGSSVYLRMVRDSTAISVGAAAGSRVVCSTGNAGDQTYSNGSFAISFLDSPSTSGSAVTYKLQCLSQTGGSSARINYRGDDSDGASWGRGATTITVMEIEV